MNNVEDENNQTPNKTNQNDNNISNSKSSSSLNKKDDSNSKQENESPFKEEFIIEISQKSSEDREDKEKKGQNEDKGKIMMEETNELGQLLGKKHKQLVIQEEELDKDFENELKKISHSGTTELSWEYLQKNFIIYYKKIVEEFPLVKDDNLSDINNNNINTEGISNIDDDIIEYLSSFTKIPFTIQRMAELILEPKEYYKTANKYNSAFKKLVNIDFE